MLRIDPKTQRPTGLTIRNYYHHAIASREIPLPGIEEHSDVKPLLLSILGSAPVSQFLSVTAGKQGISATLLSPSLQQAVAG
ncbi:MAG: hypothetical protein U1E51_16740 [Candidatus Binatia bacterium]|nr:hypothetical protein [Candidatus Binatia bacterium]